MKIFNILTSELNKFRVKSMTHPMAFRWDGQSMTLYQSGSIFTLKGIFQGCFMPNTLVKGILLPKDLNKLIEIQEYVDNNIYDLMLTPRKWGYDIYKLNSTKGGGNPLLVHELRLFSIKSFLPVLLCKWFVPSLRIPLKNV